MSGYHIVFCPRDCMGSPSKREANKEKIDEAETASEAEILLQEYAIAFGNKMSVWIEDPDSGKRLTVPLLMVREVYLGKAGKK